MKYVRIQPAAYRHHSTMAFGALKERERERERERKREREREREKKEEKKPRMK